MKRRSLVIIASAILSSAANGQITRSTLGMMIDANAGLRTVYGIPASTTLGESPVNGVISAGCSDSVCLAKTADALCSIATNGSSAFETTMAAPAGPVLFAFAGAGAYVYFTRSRSLYYWHLTGDGQAQLDPAPFPDSGEIVSLRISGDGLDYAVRRDSGFWIEHYSFALQSVFIVSAGVVSGVQPAPAIVHLLDGGMLLSDQGVVHLIRTDGTDIPIPLAGVTSFHQMSDGYVQAVNADGAWGIRTDHGQEQVFLLPGVVARTSPPQPIRRDLLKSGSGRGETQ